MVTSLSKDVGTVRVRIAPSPTGFLHVGLARTALFNELFARHHGGAFIVRIEDTDAARSKPEFERAILEGLSWLGLAWDEGPDKGGDFGPYRQSERKEIYRAELTRLLESGKAVRDTSGGGEAIKLLVSPQLVTFADAVRGEVSVHSDTFGGDFIIARSLDDPLYHLAAVVDDAKMQITHIIRGEDHISNTPKHILLQQALGYPQPLYAHVPLLVDEQRRKLSKRQQATDLSHYRWQGYLPQALLNYLVLLGWSPKTDQEIFTRDELIRLFSLAGIQRGAAIFSTVKLNNLNRIYLKQLTPAQLIEAATPFLKRENIPLDNPNFVRQALQTEQTRVTTLAQLPEAIKYFFSSADYPPSLLLWRSSTAQYTKECLDKLIAFITALPPDEFSESVLKQRILDWIDREQRGRGETLWPMRVALTGREHSPGPFEVAAILGKTETIKRLQQARKRVDSLL